MPRPFADYFLFRDTTISRSLNTNPKIASRMISKGAEKEKYFVVKREASNRANAFLSRAQSSEILRGLRHYISKELYNQTPFQVASYAYVHKHPWICHRSKNKHQTPPSFSPLNPLALSSLLFSSLPLPAPFLLPRTTLLVHNPTKRNISAVERTITTPTTTTTTTIFVFFLEIDFRKSENDNRTKSEDRSKSSSLNE
jgi:hypothetical protein